jgi:hypothetical protein
MKLTRLAIAVFVFLAIVAAVAVPKTQANPPFQSATYTGTTSEGRSIVLFVNSAGNALAPGSYINFTCGGHVATRYLGGTSINNPAGITNALGTGGVTNPNGATAPGFDGGTLSWRFFARFFPSSAAPPSGSGQTLPPGDLASGDFSGRNVTGIPGGAGFCSFRVTWNATRTH